MRIRPAFAALVVSALALGSAVAIAQDKKADAAPAAPPAGGKREIPKDPEGIRGISPYMEAIAKGDASFLARDLAGAVAAYQDAIKLDTSKMLGFYRLGEAQLASNKPEEAEAAWQTALGKQGTADMKAKVLFVLADLRERQNKLPEAKEAWTAYANFIKDNEKAKGYPATPEDRIKRIEQREKDIAEYAKVKERIAERQKQREKEAEENAKKDTKNR